jgi:oligopeptide transport system substrate-binding protein
LNFLGRRGAAITLFALALMAAACSPAAPQGPYLNRGNGGEPKSLDPHHIDGTWEANIEGDLFVGLTTEDPAGNPIPGAATGWETSPDGLTWTFHIRKAVWSDGVPVTAQDFVFAWERLLEPKNAAPYAYNMWVVKNARAISDGKLPPSALGVSAPDSRTFIVRLEHPAAYLPQLLMHQTAYPVPRHLVVKLGDAWSRQHNIVTNGPYVVKEWVPNDHVTLAKNPRFYDAAHVRIATVRYFDTTDSQAALMEFRGRQLDTQNPYPALSIDWMRAHIPGAIRGAPYMGIDYIAINVLHKPLDDVRIREALNLAYNREVITGKIRRIGELPAYDMIPPGVANYPNTGALDFKSLPYGACLAKARALMAEAGYGPHRHLHLNYVTSTNPDSRRSAALVQQMLSQIYIDMTIRSVELQVLYSRLQSHDFDIANAVWIADFNDASNFLDLLRTGGGNNYGSYSNPRFDALLDKAQQTVDLKTRGQIMQQAEDIALADYAWVPCYFEVTQDIVQPWVKGWVPNLRDFNRSRWLWIDGRP